MDGVLLTVLSLLISVWLSLLVIVLFLRASHVGEGRSALVGTVLVLGSGITVAVLTKINGLPIAFAVPIREGLTRRNIELLLGRLPGAGPLYEALVLWLTADKGRQEAFSSILLVNQILFPACAALLALIAWRVTRSWLVGGVFAFFFFTSSPMRNAAFSEQPALLICLLFFVAVIGSFTFEQLPRGPLRWIPLALVWVCTILLAMLRLELLVVGLVASFMLLVRKVLSEGQEEWLAGWFKEKALGVLKLPLVFHLLAVFVSLYLLETLRPRPASLTHGVHAIIPWSPTWSTWPVALAQMVPLSVVVLAILGLVYSIRRFNAFLLFPFSLLVLYRAYISGAHGHKTILMLELHRYFTVLTPMFLLLAVFGWHELRNLAQRLDWPEWWKRPALLFLLMLTVGGRAPGHHELIRGGTSAMRLRGEKVGLLNRDMQREMRFLLTEMQKTPECVVVVPVLGRVRSGGRGEPAHLILGGQLTRADSLHRSEGSLLEDLEQQYGNFPCFRYFRGLDCNHPLSHGCEEEVEGLALLAEREFVHLPYGSYEDYGSLNSPIRLGFYELKRNGDSGAEREVFLDSEPADDSELDSEEAFSDES